MHLRMIYKYSVNRSLHKLLIFMATICLCIVLFGLLLVSLFAWNYVSWGRKSCDKCLNGGIKQTGLIELDIDWEKESNTCDSFVKEALQMKEINSIGSHTIGGNNYSSLSELIERQNQLEGTDDTNFWMLYLNQEATSMCHMDLQKGKLPEEYEMTEEVELLYLGSNYADVPIGTTYEIKEEGTVTDCYYVAGILREGTKWISEDVYLEDSILDARYIENLDNLAIFVEKDIGSFRLTYTVMKGNSIKEAETKLRDLAEKYGLKMQFATLEDVFMEKEAQQAYVFVTIKKMIVIILLTAFVLLLCTQLTEILDDMQYFGIFYANGASTRDLMFILLGENVIKIIISYGLAVVGVYYGIKYIWSIYQPGVENWEKAMNIFFRQTLIPTFFLGSALTLLVTLIPILWVKRKSPTEMLRGYKV